MMIFKTYKKILPIVVFFTDCCIPKRFGGYNVGPVNFIKPQYRNDLGLIYHEIFHSKQFWKNPVKYCLGRWLKYFKFLPEKWISWSYKKTFEFETEAYGFQLAFYVKHKFINTNETTELLEKFATWVVTKYNIEGYSKQDALLAIRSHYLRFLQNLSIDPET